MKRFHSGRHRKHVVRSNLQSGLHSDPDMIRSFAIYGFRERIFFFRRGALFERQGPDGKSDSRNLSFNERKGLIIPLGDSGYLTQSHGRSEFDAD